jgi:T5SS/PEP-CTERM-associated repeat protein
VDRQSKLFPAGSRPVRHELKMTRLSSFRVLTALVRAALFFPGGLGMAVPALGQLVPDGGSNTLLGVTLDLGPTNLVIGSNASGTMLILGGATTLTGSTAQIGLGASSSNNLMIVDGTNTSWFNNGAVQVGAGGPGNTLRVANGASVRASGVSVGAQATSTNNRLEVAGGLLVVSNLAGSADLDVRRGEVVLRGGRIEADRLLLTNAAGAFGFEAGTLVTRGAVVNHGRPFTVGARAGAGVATWDIRGGTAPTSVAQGLVVGSGSAFALAFNGADQYVAVTNFGDIAPTNEVTVEFWAYPTKNAEQSAFMLEPDDFGNRFQAHINYADGRTYWDFGNLASTNARIDCPTPPGALSNWTHYALVASESGNFMRIYRNGVLVTNRPGMTRFTRGSYELRLGGGPGFFFNGRLDEFRVWSAALSAAQIQSNLNRTLTGSEPDLLLHYSFDSGTGNVAVNSAAATGTNFNAILVNGPAWVPSTALQTLTGITERAVVLLTNGATLGVSGDAVIGSTASATNNLVMVSGAGSHWTNAGTIQLGAASALNALQIDAGARVSSASASVGLARGADLNRVTVAGAGSVWSNAGTLTLGGSGSANTLLITNGGTVHTVTGEVGAGPEATGNQVRVTGAGSIWTNANQLTVGGSGSGNVLGIASGGRVLGGDAHIGFAAGSSNNQIRAGDANSQLVLGRDLYVGLAGRGNALLITNGAQAISRAGYIGYAVGAAVNTGVVAGAGSTWTNSDTLEIGAAGAANSLFVTEAGRVTSRAGVLGGAAVASNNTVAVAGPGASWNIGTDLWVGNFGSFNRLSLSNGGVVANNTGYVGHDSAATGNGVWVDGSGTVWANLAALHLGFQGASNWLVITNGGWVISGAGVVGSGTNAGGNVVTVTGPGSRWTSSSIEMGRAGSGNRLIVTNGATVSAGGLTVGVEPTALGNLVAVGGGNLMVTNAAAGAVLEARRGNVTLNGGQIIADHLVLTNSGGSLAIHSGTLITRRATISNGQTFLMGGASGGGPATWEVRSNPSPSTVSGDLVVGSQAPNARLVITNGGRLSVSGFSLLGETDAAANASALVAGAGSSWSIAGLLAVGFDGSGGSLVVSNGARLHSSSAVIGLGPFGGGHHNAALVTGASSVWTNQNELHIGGTGSTNRLIISAGGTVQAREVVVGADAASTGNSLLVSNGTLTVTHPGGSGILDIRGGHLSVSGGVVTADRLRLAEPTGALMFNAGALNVGSASVGNGSPFVVGANGAAPATLRLTGAATNLHSFASGLVIASNGTLAGSGTIAGDVTSFGAIRPGDSPGGLRINGSLNLAASAGMFFEIAGLIPTNGYDRVTVTNFVQFAGTLSLALLDGFIPAPGDSFTLMTYAGRAGNFDNAPHGAVVLTEDRLRQFTVSYTASNLVAANFQPSLVLTSITPAAGEVAVRFQSVAGNKYQVQYSSTLTNWTDAAGPILTNVVTGITTWIDDGSTTGGSLPAMRFYRVRLVP